MNRYAKLARMYRAVTSPVPAARAKGRLRRGFFTSPAMKVTLFHASEEKSEPTCATQKATNIPRTPSVANTVGIEEKYGCTGETACGVQRLEKLALMTAALRPMKNPMRMSATSERVLAEVKVF